MLARAILLTLISLFLFAPLQANAQQTDAAAAEALFQEGRDAMNDGDYDEACTYFAESFSLDPAVGTILNLATCEEKRGHLADSWERWHQALDLLDENDDRVAFAMAQLASIEQRIAHLTVTVKKEVGASLTVKRDGVILGEASWGISLPADPGKHIIEVSGPEYEPRRFTVRLDPGQEQELVVFPGHRKPPENMKGDRGRTARFAGGIAALGLGVAGVATAVVTGVMLPPVDARAEEHCPNGRCDDTGWDAVNQAKTLLALNMTGWIVGGVGLATGGVLLFTLPKKKEAAPKDGPAKSQKRAAWHDLELNPESERETAALAVTYLGTGVRVFGTF